MIVFDRWWDVLLPNGTELKVRASSLQRARWLVGLKDQDEESLKLIEPQTEEEIEKAKRSEVKSIMQDLMHQVRQVNVTLKEADERGVDIHVQLVQFDHPTRIVGQAFHVGYGIRQGIGGVWPG